MRSIVRFNFRETQTRQHLLSYPHSLLMEDSCNSSTSNYQSPSSVIEVTTLTSLSDITVSPPLAPKMAPSSKFSKTTKQTSQQSRLTTKLAKKKQQTVPTAARNSNVCDEIKKFNRDEKSMVKIDYHPTAISGLKSSVWFKVTHIDWKEMHRFFKLESPDFRIHKGLANIDDILCERRNQASVAKGVFTPFYRRAILCPICLADDTVSLEDSIQRVNLNSTSNIIYHFETHHPEAVASLKGSQVSDTTSTATTKSSSSLNKSNAERRSALNPRTGPIDLFANNIPTTKAESRNQVHKAIYECVNDLGFPASTVERPVFRNLLECVRRNASNLSSSDFDVSNKFLTQLRVKSYNNFVELIAKLAQNVHLAYVDICGREIPFATICHDIWSGNKKDVLGVSIMFADPRDGSLYCIPLGLLYAKGHSAAQVCAMTKSLMVSFGFSSKALFHSVNDNTNSAVLAGKYILEHRGEGKCDMHKTDLVLKHATGLVVRTRNKQTIDSNPSFTSLYKTIREFVSWLMNKVARSRYNNLKQHCATKNRRVIEIPLPNKTRVAGVAIMYKALIRNKWEMDAYAALPHGGDSAFTKKYPTMEQWQQLAEFEAVLDPLQRCSISLQTDDPAINSASMLEIYLCRRHIERMRNGCLYVLSMDASTYSKGDLWDASAQMEDLNKKRRKVEFPNLLPPTRHLIHRLVKEFQSYVITENDTKSELTICANPLLIIMAPRAFKYMGYFDDKDIEAIIIASSATWLTSLLVNHMNLVLHLPDKRNLPIQLIRLRTTTILLRTTTTMTKKIMVTTFSVQWPYKRQRSNNNLET